VTSLFPSQPDARTIEGVLFDAMVKAGAVSKDNADDPVKVSYNYLTFMDNCDELFYCFKVNLARAARTDAGVHAAGNLVSIKMIVTVPGVSDLVAHINEELPPEIRVWGYVRAILTQWLIRVYMSALQVRVQNSFNARTSVC
jgi:tRNA pseudouridine38-40 synthase